MAHIKAQSSRGRGLGMPCGHDLYDLWLALTVLTLAELFGYTGLRFGKLPRVGHDADRA